MSASPGRPALAVASALASAGLMVVMVLWPWAGVVCMGVAFAAAATAKVRRERASALAVSRELPEVIELLRIGAEGGLNLRLSIESVREISPGPVADALGRAARAAEAGASLGDAIEDNALSLGPSVRPLVSALASSARYGVPLVPVLERLAADARVEERRCGEAEARKVPVKLLFPLVLCILPAFALLTVAPLIAGGLEPLRLP